MHEMSIASTLIEQVLDIAQANDAVKVEKITLQAGQLKQIVNEMLITAWQSVTIDTIAEGSHLIIEDVPAEVLCKVCSEEFSPNVDNFLCPDCGQADYEILKGDELILAAIECKSKDNIDNA